MFVQLVGGGGGSWYLRALVIPASSRLTNQMSCLPGLTFFNSTYLSDFKASRFLFLSELSSPTAVTLQSTGRVISTAVRNRSCNPV